MAHADRRAGGVALQPHRRAATRPLPPGRADDHGRRAPTGTSPIVTTSTPARCTTCSTSSARRSTARRCCRSRAARTSRHRSSSPTRSTVATRQRSRGSSSTPARTARSPSSSGSSPTAAGAALVVPRLFVRAQQAARVTYVAINELEHVGVAARSSAGHRRARLDDAAGDGRPRRRVRQGAHRREGRRPGRQHPPGRAVLRRREPDARLPHVAGPRRAAHDQRPACSRARCRTPPGACTPA